SRHRALGSAGARCRADASDLLLAASPIHACAPAALAGPRSWLGWRRQRTLPGCRVPSGGGEQALLQSRALQRGAAPRRARAGPAACAPGDGVRCPGSGRPCAGGQCCPAAVGSGGTFPCPSQEASFSGCVNNTKVVDCLDSEERQEVAAEPRTCAPAGEVACPGSGNACAGDQCCPAAMGSGGTFLRHFHRTIPCPSASVNFSGCVNNTKVFNCLATSLAQGAAVEEQGAPPPHCAGVPLQSDRYADYPLGGGTIFELKNIVQPSDPTTYQGDLLDAGRGTPEMYDRKDNKFANRDAFLFKCTFTYDRTDYPLTLRASAEDFVDHGEVRLRIEPFLKSVGRMPEVLMQNLRYLHIYKGTHPWGGNPYYQTLMMYLDKYDHDQIGEVVMHELSHTSLDNRLSPGRYAEAVDSDCKQYFSKYARDEPGRESFAEGFLVYFAYTYRKDRLTEVQAENIIKTGPHQIAFFDANILRQYTHPPS
ncbi:unnamed protein product, partial [Prorocentrum cordatum]